MKKYFLLACALGAFGVADAATVQFSSPDKKLVVTVADDGGRPVYRVDYGETTFLAPSPLGLLTNIGDFSQGMALQESSFAVSPVSGHYELPTIKRSKVDVQATKAVCPFYKDGKHIFDVVFHVSDHDVAFKYKVYPQGNTLCCVVKDETTGFVLPQGTTTFLCPQSGPMGGFARTSPSYETGYTVDNEMGKNGWGHGYTFPCLFRTGDKGWVLISETGVDSRYCASRLMGKDGGLYTIGFPQEGEYNGNGTTSPGISLPGETPWRTKKGRSL